MPDSTTRSEAELASERNENLQRGLKSKRLNSILLTTFCILVATISAYIGLAMVAFCLAVVGLICLVRYFDANSHLHEVRRRSKSTLAPHLSVLARDDQASSNQGQPIAPH